jgi:dTDP-4-dehydrorhamnose reductase
VEESDPESPGVEESDHRVPGVEEADPVALPPMRILVTGAAGMLGTDVCRVATDTGLEVLPYDRARLDVTDAAAVEEATRRAAPDMVVNCAAWTDVDGAETSPEAALSVNEAGAANVARAAARCEAWTVHVSTDYVFDGTKSEPYVESDPVAPLSQYGRTKLEGEVAVAREAPDQHTIVRSSWLFGVAGRCFPKTILRLAAERDELTVVADQVGCPTFTAHLAGALIDLGSTRRAPGVVHVAAAGQCSWFEFSREIVASAQLPTQIKPGATSEMARPAPRPAYSVLRSERAEAPTLPDWHQGLEEFMAARVAVS